MGRRGEAGKSEPPLLQWRPPSRDGEGGRHWSPSASEGARWAAHAMISNKMRARTLEAGGAGAGVAGACGNGRTRGWVGRRARAALAPCHDA